MGCMKSFRLIIGFLIFVMIVGCNNQNILKIPNDSELIDLAVKFLIDSENGKISIRDDSIFYNNKKLYELADTVRILDSITKNKYIDDLVLKRLNIFSKNDFEFMVSQNEVEITYDFKRLLKEGIVLINKVNLKEFRKNEFHAPYYSMSKPLYSLDYNKALLNVDFNFSDSSRGYVLILEKVNDKWIVKKMIQTWVA